MSAHHVVGMRLDGRVVHVYGEGGLAVKGGRQEQVVVALIVGQGRRRRLAMCAGVASWLDRVGLARMAQRGCEWRVRG